ALLVLFCPSGALLVPFCPSVDSGAEETIIAGYNVTVQERVSPVVLKESSVSLSPESCKVTVTCSTQSSSLKSTFTCTPRTCSEDGGDPAEFVTSDAPLNLYLSNGSIAICNHSNKVSWSNDTMEIKPLCSGFRDNNPNYEILNILCQLVFVIPIIILVICYCWRKKKNHLKVHFDQSSNCDPAAAVYMNPGYQSGRGGSVPMGTDPDKIRLEQSYRRGAQDQGRVRDSGPLSGALGPESCNVTVTCSTQSSSLNSTFTCTPRTCSEDGGDPEEVVTSDARLNLYLSNGLIGICNHSNKVSWSNDTMEIKPLCFKDGMNAISSPRVPLIIISSCLVGIIMAMCTLGICYCKWTKNNHPTDNRETHSPGSEDQSPNCDQSPTVYSLSSVMMTFVTRAFFTPTL
ncbi:unnamed protein product, partial [Gadus morhua 'NCC']